MKSKFSFNLVPRWELAPAAASPARSCPGSGLLGSHLLFAQGDEERTVEAQRRRPGGPAGPGGRERAQAPRRRQTSDEGRGAPSGGGGEYGGGGFGGTGGAGGLGGMGGSGSQLPIGDLINLLLRHPKLAIALLVILVVCVLPVLCLTQGGGNLNLNPPAEQTFTQEPQQAFPSQAEEPTLTPRPRPTRTPTPAPEGGATVAAPSLGATGQKWLVLLYQDADDKILEQDIYVDLNEAEKVGSGNGVQIIAQIDRYRGAYRGDGNWTGARRY